PRQADGSLQQIDGAGSGITSPKEPGGYLNQDAVNRIGRAGIAVHGLGIGTSQPPPAPSRGPAPPIPERKIGAQHIQELQSRLSGRPGAPKSELPPISSADA